MTTIERIAALEQTAEAVGGSVQREYSGRGMFGASCYGIACDSPTDCIEEAAARGVRGAKVDQLGKGFIVYWPGLSAAEGPGLANDARPAEAP